MSYVYSNNGLSFHAVDPSYTVQSGEVMFSDYATPAQLAAAFSNYTAAKNKAAVEAQITALEATMTPRRIREAANGTDNGWLKALDAQIVTLRTQLQ